MPWTTPIPLTRGGWHETFGDANAAAADLVWERCQEQAALAFRAGDAVAAPRLWAQALAVAEEHFGRGDPRLATSYTNQALVLRRRRQDYQAQQMFTWALQVWDDSWRWILLMTPGPARHDAASNQLQIYDRNALADFATLAERGRAVTAAIERHDQLPVGGLEEWFRIKPSRLSDLRKLLSAVLLIAPRPH